MNIEERNKLTNQFLDRCREIMDQKGRQYNRNGDDSFANFREMAEDEDPNLPEIMRIRLAIYRTCKRKQTIVTAWCKGEIPFTLDVEDALCDSSNYPALLWVTRIMEVEEEKRMRRDAAV